MSAESEHWQNRSDRYWYGQRENDRWGVYDRASQDWTGDFTGRDAEREASARCRALKREQGGRTSDSRARASLASDPPPSSDEELTRTVKEREREEARSLVRRTRRSR